jgi:hypothetical protein
MMIITSATILSLVMFFAAACSDPSDSMRSWIGQDGSELIRVWGQPSEETDIEGAGRTMTYISFWKDGFFETYTCRRAFTTDAEGVIRSQSASGC